MYKQIYPEFDNMTIPVSCNRCSAAFLGEEVFGSLQSRHKRSSYVMAYWNTANGSIIDEIGTGELTPGIVQKFIIHNLIVGDESRLHLLALVKWLLPLADPLRYYCGKPVEAWGCDMYDDFGPSAFMPIQRINCKFVRADGNLSGKYVSFICPISKGLNV